jgi:ABC-type uncharacterized transport system substrate-binding protein
MGYGVSVPDFYAHAATFVDKVLKGAKPGDLPVYQPTKFKPVINPKTARALGLFRAEGDRGGWVPATRLPDLRAAAATVGW